MSGGGPEGVPPAPLADDADPDGADPDDTAPDDTAPDDADPDDTAPDDTAPAEEVTAAAEAEAEAEDDVVPAPPDGPRQAAVTARRIGVIERICIGDEAYAARRSIDSRRDRPRAKRGYPPRGTP